MPINPPLRASHPRPLAARIAASFGSVLALATSPVAADTWIVNSCDEDSHATVPGPNTGTLRWAIEQSNANPNPTADIIDLSGLTGANACADSKITLTTGELLIGHADVTVKGPGTSTLTIDGSGLGTPSAATGVLRDYHPDGTLTIQDLGMTGGRRVGVGTFANGGCIQSQANVVLVNSSVSNCYVKSGGGAPARGGGVYASGGLAYASVTLINSSVHDNYAYGADYVALGGGVATKGDVTVSSGSLIENNSAASHLANGGGVYAGGSLSITNSILRYNSVSGEYAAGGGAVAIGNFSVHYSTIDRNSAMATNTAAGGGSFSFGNIEIANSTISNNSAPYAGGLYVASPVDADKSVTITNSTISGNTAGDWAGGIFANMEIVDIYNSTIAFNTAGSGMYNMNSYAPGLALKIRSGATITLQSSLLSGNTYGSTEVDFSTANGSPSIGGSNNFIRVAAVGTNVPGGTIDSVCPLLGPLRDNGGPTMTHALFSTSPAIDAGNSMVVDAFDQRGSVVINGVQDYVRASGTAADIGAYEVQQTDIVFNAAFEGCPALP